jgi:hypothetical protein
MTPTHCADPTVPAASASASPASASSAASPSADPAASPIVPVDDNGGWCWFQDERALVDPETGHLLIGSVASQAGADGDRRGGDVDLTVVDLGAIGGGAGEGQPDGDAAEDPSAAPGARTITLQRGPRIGRP